MISVCWKGGGIRLTDKNANQRLLVTAGTNDPKQIPNRLFGTDKPYVLLTVEDICLTRSTVDIWRNTNSIARNQTN